jgi:hypothetical protein
MIKSNLKALNACFRAKSLTYEWTKESSYVIFLITKIDFIILKNSQHIS